MSQNEMEDRLAVLCESILDVRGLELVALEFGRGPQSVVRVYIDWPGSTRRVTVQECAEVSRLLSPALEVEDWIPGAYVLEVSSPGVERPIKKAKDFVRFRGQLVRISTTEPVDGRTFFSGPIAEADDEAVTVDHDGEWIRVPYGVVGKANLAFQFGSSPG